MRGGAVAVEREAKAAFWTSRAEWLWLGFKLCDPLLKRDRWRNPVGVLDLRGNKSRRDPASSGQRNRCTCRRGGHTNFPIVITNRARGHVLTVEELRRPANLE